MTLALTFLLGTFALTALLWGLSLVVQGYLYSQPADRLAIRSVVAGVLIAGMITFWVYANTRASHKDKYGTLFEFQPTALKEIQEFEAVRQLRTKDEKGQPKEATVLFKWQAASSGGKFVGPDNKDFQTNTSDYMTIAMLVPDDGKKTRYAADLSGGSYTARKDEERRFTEEGGERYIDARNPHQLVVPSTMAFVLAVLINLLFFVIWFVAFWPVLKYSVGHAIGMAALFGAVMMLGLMPLLFTMNAVKPAILVTAP